jgi:hypothetical protein
MDYPVSERDRQRVASAADFQDPDARFEILKIRPDGPVSVGTILGIEYAKRVLVCLNSTENELYFLYNRSTLRLVDPPELTV